MYVGDVLWIDCVEYDVGVFVVYCDDFVLWVD